MLACFARRWAIIPTLAVFCCGWSICLAQASSDHTNEPITRNAAHYPGASIVERIQAAILDCHNSPCEVFVPTGNYEASPISSWQQRDSTGSRAGVILPSNVDLRGAGVGHTIIKVQRASDPPATLFANAPGLGRNIHLHDMSIVWNDSSSSYDWVSIFICHACHDVELDHLSLEGNPNKLVNLLDSTASSIHDNTFLLRSASYGHGDNAISFSRFDPSLEVNNEAGVVRDNRFAEIGDSRTFSMLIVAQSGIYVHDNVFEAHLPPPGNATGIESGQDNLGHLPTKVRISSNIFHGASIAYGGLDTSEISGNFLDHGDIYIALQEGSTGSVSQLTIADNELHFGTINVGGLAHTFTGRSTITRNRVFDGGISAGNSLVMRDMEVSFNSVRDTAGRAGIECDACSVIRGNLVREVGQNGPGERSAGYVISGSPVDVSDNIYLDEQHEYDTGTVCSVAKPSSTVCMTSGKSRWVMLRGGEWGFGWTNRVLFTDRGDRLIRAFVNSSLVETDDDADALPAGTHYHLLRTTYNAFQFNNATIDRFANNTAIATSGAFRNATIEENGQITIRSLSGNVFRPYKCVGTCAIDYRGNVNGTE
ncbi:MAG TPA: hypothetical protein VLV47_00080 [Candidatus Bathyarchaeia archaeon]|nr:hypothetical protein [Candidatus Bathyarchaeia archaeon]